MANFIRALLLTLSIGAVDAGAAPEAPPKPDPRSAEVTLSQGNSVTIAPDTTLRFDSVNDSRCRKDVMCVWAGKLVYNFTLAASTAESFKLDEDAPKFAATTVPGMSIALANKTTPPLPVADTAAPTYTVTVQVSR